MKSWACSLAILCLIGPSLDIPSVAHAAELLVSPSSISLTNRTSAVQLQISWRDDSGITSDLTRSAELKISNELLVTCDQNRQLRPLANGQATVTVTANGQTIAIPLTVSGADQPLPIDFELDVMPILTRFSCNSGPCHGKQRGQNGFQLSLLGFDANFDHEALVYEGRGRRVFFPSPSESLLLQKPLGTVPHGGGVRLSAESPEYETLAAWVSGGAPRQSGSSQKLTGIVVTPNEKILPRGQQQQLRVVANYSDGSSRDVTHLAAYQSNEAPVAAVNENGLMTAGQILGDTAIMARYEGQIAVCTVVVPHPSPAPADIYATLPRRNPVDNLVWDRLQKLGVAPSPAADESVVLRRLYLDIIGRAPTSEEARAYLQDSSADRRNRLIEQLLNHPEYPEHWANKWTDLLRPNPYRVGIKATLNYDAWIRDAFRRNLPYDEFVRQLVTAQGSTFRNGSVVLFRDRRTPDEITVLVSQLFLGIRLDCARCHHHPFEVYGQKEFYSFAAYFGEVGRKGVGISAPISGSEEFVFHSGKGKVQHPITGETLPPKPIYGNAPDLTTGTDPRRALAAWMTSPENTYFQRTIANRVWSDLMGRGLVEPVDDLRATNPPSNPELLNWLGQDFAQHGFDLKHLIRTVASSYVYGLSSLPNESNVADYRSFSRHYRQRLRAEVLLDTVTQVTGVPESFNAMPPDSQARELWTARIESLFLDAFGRQDPNQDPPCERNPDPTIVQALHLMNAETLFQKVSADKGRASELAASDKTSEQIIEELYLSVLARFPSQDEKQHALSFYAEEGADRRQTTEDLMWALMNTPEFVFKD